MKGLREACLDPSLKNTIKVWKEWNPPQLTYSLQGKDPSILFIFVPQE